MASIDWWMVAFPAAIALLPKALYYLAGNYRGGPGPGVRKIVAPATNAVAVSLDRPRTPTDMVDNPTPGVPFTIEGMAQLELAWVLNDHLDMTLDEFIQYDYHWGYCSICKTEYLLDNSHQYLLCGVCGAGNYCPNEPDAREKAQAWLRKCGTSLEESQAGWAKHPLIKPSSELERIPQSHEHEKDRIIAQQSADIRRLRVLLREARQAAREKEEVQKFTSGPMRASVRRDQGRGGHHPGRS